FYRGGGGGLPAGAPGFHPPHPAAFRDEFLVAASPPPGFADYGGFHKVGDPNAATKYAALAVALSDLSKFLAEASGAVWFEDVVSAGAVEGKYGVAVSSEV
ncbi:MAG: hypothetical protein K2V38_09095, partial [Gemmataceae bacterium]|nr:hypothetical protein [Gemmataceae bacterium]